MTATFVPINNIWFFDLMYLVRLRDELIHVQGARRLEYVSVSDSDREFERLDYGQVERIVPYYSTAL